MRISVLKTISNLCLVWILVTLCADHSFAAKKGYWTKRKFDDGSMTFFFHEETSEDPTLALVSMSTELRHQYMKDLAHDFLKFLNELQNKTSESGSPYRVLPLQKKEFKKQLLAIPDQVWSPQKHTVDLKKYALFDPAKKTLIFIESIALLAMPYMSSWFSAHALAELHKTNPVLTSSLCILSALLSSAATLTVGSLANEKLEAEFIKYKTKINENKAQDALFEPFYEELGKLGFTGIPEDFEKRKEWLNEKINTALCQTPLLRIAKKPEPIAAEFNETNAEAEIDADEPVLKKIKFLSN